MRCEKFRRMLSDDMGGALAPRSKDSLSRHLSSCPSCRAYCESLLKLQSGAQGLNRGAERPDSYWRDFGARLEARLVAERSGAPVRAPRASRRIWIWSGAGLAAAAAAAAAFVLIRPEGAPPGPFV
ncbi:MAG: zf-HC2 domain-containing protein, partial [Candidatus Aminicenantes bacterium]|nr:zf-HC2 domain-containing protein [Candidatus Aminicenantes bacterium]